MVQITGVEDDKEDGPQKYTITTSPATSQDLTYHTINPIDPEVTNNDDDTVAIRACNDRLAADNRLTTVLLPMADGLPMCVKN